MTSEVDHNETYDDAVRRQTNFFRENFGCSTSPTFYFIHFEDGYAHWSAYPWGWGLRYLNNPKGEPNQCGKEIGWNTAICEKCYKEKGDEIHTACGQFDQELKEKHQKSIKAQIAKGKNIGVVTFK